MKKADTIFLILNRIVILTLTLGLFACSKSDHPVNSNRDIEIGGETKPSIIQFTQSVDVLSAFVTTLEKIDANLRATLSTDSPKTLFVPTNDAFDTFLSELEGFESLSDFDEAAEVELLEEIIKYHIVSSKAAYSNELSNGKLLETIQSEELLVEVDTNMYLQDKTNKQSKVLRADNEAKNGVVHIIDKVLLPQAVLELLFPKPPLQDLVSQTDSLNLFEEAIEKAGMGDAIHGDRTLTIFAPSNQAIQLLFDFMGDGFNTFDDFNNPIEIQALRDIIWGHIVVGDLASKDFVVGKLNTSLPGDYIELVAVEDTFEIRDASEVNTKFLSLDNEALNGRFHIIDKILIPHKIMDFIE